jgi:type II secretory pathway component PulF
VGNLANKLEMIYNSLSNMLGAGVPVVKALRTAASAGRRHHRHAFNQLAELASQGESIADGMERNPKVFKVMDTQLIRVGEESGGLPRIIKELSNWYALSNRVQRIIKGRVIFPLLQLHFVAFFVPGILYFMHDFSNGMIGYTADKSIKLCIGILSVLYVPATIGFLIVRFTPQTGPLRVTMDAIVQRIPGISAAFRHLAYARYFRNFQLCLNSGMPIVETCRIACDATGNGVIALRFQGGIQAAKDGKDVSEGFKRLPEEIMYSWLNGEQTGDLDIVCGRLADHSIHESERMFQVVADWVPRLIYGMVAILIIYFIVMLAQYAFGITATAIGESSR